MSNLVEWYVPALLALLGLASTLAVAMNTAA